MGSRAFLMGPVLQFFFSSDFLVRLKSKSLVFEDKWEMIRKKWGENASSYINQGKIIKVNRSQRGKKKHLLVSTAFYATQKQP